MPYVVDKLPFLFSADDIDRLADNPASGKCYVVTNVGTRRKFRIGYCGPGRQYRGLRGVARRRKRR
jgi:hypothetical protein